MRSVDMFCDPFRPLPNCCCACRGFSRRCGFSLVEAMVPLTLLGLMGGVLLLGVESSLNSTTDAVEQTQAAGVAKQLVDEILGTRYMGLGITPYQEPLVANSWELQSNGRERYDDTDDFNGYQAQPVEDTWGEELGRGDWVGGLRAPGFQMSAGYFRDWREEVEVYYVDENDPSQRLPSNRTSNLRAVDVRIYRDSPQGGSREIARIRRVYAYVPPPQ
jgi:type II secretory pathway pseudopilin PulG